MAFKIRAKIKKPFTAHCSPFTKKKGFTLVELAIVLIIIGLLTGVGVGLIGPLTKRAKLIETRETVKAAYEAILGYAAANKKLPNDLSALGVKTTDSYNRPLQYFRAPEFVSNNLCTSTATYLIVNDNSSGTPQTKTNVAFILFSEGPNMCNQTGTASPFTIAVQDAVVACQQDPNAGYDDIVMYADIDKLRSQICAPFKITTDSLPMGTEEEPYPSTTLEATDGTQPYTWGIQSGSLPPGLTLSSDGVISGTPTTDGSYKFTVRVCDNDDTNPPNDCPPTTNKDRLATKSLTITINPNKPRITTEFLTYGTVNQPYPSTTLSATGGKPGYTWSLASGSLPLPPGLSLSSDGTISGTPTAAGTYPFTVEVTDTGSRKAYKTLSIAINESTSSTSSSSSSSGSSSSSSSTSTSTSSTTSTSTSSGGGSCRDMTITVQHSGVKINDTGTCYANTQITISQTDSIKVWSSPNCNGNSTVYAFSVLERRDSNKNCKVKDNNSGDIVDD